MIILIGTGHVFDLSDAILDILNEREPDVIAVELDRQRYNALMIKLTDPDSYEKIEKNVPVIYKLLGQFQNNMAKEYGVNAGDEMLTAINYAQSHQIPLEFIDMNAQKLFSRMLKTMPLSEKLKMLFSGISGLFISKKRVEKEIKKIEGNFDTYIEQIGEKFPTIKKVLIDDRNSYMTQHLIGLNEKNERVVAVMGDGHVPGVSKLLTERNLDFETIRLNALRKHPSTSSQGSSTASFSIGYKEPY